MTMKKHTNFLNKNKTCKNFSPTKGSIIIKNVYPELDGGKYPVKREIGRIFEVYADVYCEEKVHVNLKYRIKGKKVWQKTRMSLIKDKKGNRYRGAFPLKKIGFYEYTIEANPVEKKHLKVEYPHILELVVDPIRARFAAWYEMFGRSQGKEPNKSATFKDMEERLPDIKTMGFDTVYLVPIHPIGKTFKKGPNNTLNAGPNDPGCPWSIGNESGGHKSVDPNLGTIEDFRHFVKTANKMGMEIALDIALTCSRDHPYIKEHPGWFFYNPDGTIKYAENPPKKYEDTYFLNFNCEDREEMWNEMKSIFIFWIKQGVKTFRVDNPHTKPTEFWQWLIREIKKEYPDVIFLSEAFTYYEKLEELARVGFDQSYSYFTWRNQKNELLEYFTYLTQGLPKEYLRANLFTNTPDILPRILQIGGPPAFKMRIVLASTLSSVYGMYNGYELLENEAIPGKEEYLNSEKYEYKVRDWNKPGNIKDYIARLNQIRKENPALHYYDNLRFYHSVNEHVIFYGKISPDKNKVLKPPPENIILVAVNLDPFNVQESRLTVPVEEFGLSSDEEYKLHELITDKIWTWKGRENYVRLDPNVEPAVIFRLI